MDYLVLHPLPRKNQGGKNISLVYLMIPPTEKVTTMICEEHVVTQEKWHRSFSWQMTFRLGLSEPPCVHRMLGL